VAVNVETSVDGRAIVELESFADDDVEAARAAGASVLWLHTNDDLSAHGFRPAGAYVRLHADEVPVRKQEPSFIEERDYAEVVARAYAGLWGHKYVSPLAQPPENAVVVGVPVVGLCTVFPDERLIDGPGVLPEGRSADAYASLLVSACAVLGAGPADLDSWGDAEETIEAYEDLGFDIVERVQGWELELLR
jgi:hypothetical protein